MGHRGPSPPMSSSPLGTLSFLSLQCSPTPRTSASTTGESLLLSWRIAHEGFRATGYPAWGLRWPHKRLLDSWSREPHQLCPKPTGTRPSRPCSSNPSPLQDAHTIHSRPPGHLGAKCLLPSSTSRGPSVPGAGPRLRALWAALVSQEVSGLPARR